MFNISQKKIFLPQCRVILVINFVKNEFASAIKEN